MSKSEDHKNHAKQHYRKRKTAMKVKKKAISFLLTEMMILIHIYMEIKRVQ